MIHLMLYYLRLKPTKSLLLPLEPMVKKFHRNKLISLGRTHSVQRKTALLGIESLFGTVNYLRVDHSDMLTADSRSEDGFMYAYHVSRHPNTAVGISRKSVQQVTHNGHIFFGGRLRFSAEDKNVPYDLSDHQPFTAIVAF